MMQFHAPHVTMKSIQHFIPIQQEVINNIIFVLQIYERRKFAAIRQRAILRVNRLSPVSIYNGFTRHNFHVQGLLPHHINHFL